MNEPKHSAQDFLLAAKQAEIKAFQQLASSCELTTRISALIHGLQRERGLSNGYLKSSGARFAEQRDQQIKLCSDHENRFRQAMPLLAADSGPLADSSRLLSSIAFVLHKLDDLPAFRLKLQQLDLSAVEATHTFSTLIAGLLTVVFEAADISADPEITRALVAMFNFMQGKEYSGQERAWGAIGFAAGKFEQIQLHRLKNLLHAQHRCFDVFVDFATGEQTRLWTTIEQNPVNQNIEKLRKVLDQLQAEEPISEELSETWYELTTRRIDLMHQLEQRLSEHLLHLSELKLRQATSELKHYRNRLQALNAIKQPPPSPLTIQVEPADLNNSNTPELHHSIYQLLKDQTDRVQTLSAELAEARQALTERKLVERAKGLLMQYQNMTEEQAYRQLRVSAMENNQRLIDVAKKVIDAVSKVQSS